MIRYLFLAMVMAACADETVPMPVPIGEGSASSGGCDSITFQCCRTEVQDPVCKNGTLQCAPEFETCPVDGGR